MYEGSFSKRHIQKFREQGKSGPTGPDEDTSERVQALLA